MKSCSIILVLASSLPIFAEDKPVTENPFAAFAKDKATANKAMAAATAAAAAVLNKGKPTKVKPDAAANAKAPAAKTKDVADKTGDDAKTDTAETANKAKDDDNIEMLSGDLIYGKIHKELPDCIIMLLRKDQARIKVPREKIKALNYSMETRLSALDKDDMEGRYKVGLWAMDKNMYPEAIGLFEYLKKKTAEEKKEGAGPDLLKQLGKAYEQRGQLDKAFANYDEYLKGHPDDSEVAEAAKKLEAQVKPKEVEAAAEAAVKIVDGLEADGNWQAETWGNANPTTVAFTTDKQGNKMIAMQSVGGTKDKMAFSRYGQPLNLSDSTEMIFKAFNDSDKPINLACAFVNAEGDFHESRFIRIMPKQWVKESVKIDAKTFKSNRNDFKEFNQEIKGREHIAKMTFMVYDQRPVKLFIDSLFFK